MAWASSLVMGLEALPSRTVSAMTCLNLRYTRGVASKWSIVVRMAEAVVSEPATIMNTDSDSHSFWVSPLRMKDPWVAMRACVTRYRGGGIMMRDD